MLVMLRNLLPCSSKLSGNGPAQVSVVAKPSANTSADSLTEETIFYVRRADVQ